MLRENSSSTSAYPPEFINTKINAAQYRICAGTIVDPQGMAIKKLKLPFLFKQAFYQNIASVALTADTTIGATTLAVNDTTNYNTSGVLWLQNNIVTYTGKTSTTFTGVSGMAYAFLSWTRVYPIFALPTDYMNTLSLQYNNAFPLEYVDENEIYQLVNQVKVWYNPYVQNWYVQNGMATMARRRAFYSILQGQYIAPFYLDNSVGMFNLSYEMIPTAMVNNTDTTIIPDDTMALDAISNLAVADVLFDRWEEDRAIRRLNYGITRTRELYIFYNRQWSEDQFGKSVRMQKGTGYNF